MELSKEAKERRERMTVKVFTSFEEMNKHDEEEDMKFWQQFTPNERLDIAAASIKRAYEILEQKKKKSE